MPMVIQGGDNVENEKYYSVSLSCLCYLSDSTIVRSACIWMGIRTSL